jgi:hypothetical protein
MEIQVYGMTNNLDEFELRLRAAGGNFGPTQSLLNQFKVEEWIFSGPSTVQSQIRLFQMMDEPENWMLTHEVEVMVDKDDAVRVVSLDRIQLQGNANGVIKSLGFKEEFRIGRSGIRVTLPGDWIVEYFHLYEPKVDKTNQSQLEATDNSSNKKRKLYVLDKPASPPTTTANGWLVSIKKQYQTEKETQPLIGEAWKIIRRLMPALQVASCAALSKSNFGA